MVIVQQGNGEQIIEDPSCMLIEPCCEINPFKSPIKATASSKPTEVSHNRTQQPDVLATADLLLEQLKEFEYYLILGSNIVDESSRARSPVCPANTPISSRLRLMSLRLRGLFDLRGPGQANLDEIQSCLDYSLEIQIEDNLSMRGDRGHSDEWVDDDDEALLCPFNDKYAVRESPRKVEKALSAIPHERVGEVLESRIPRKVYVRRQVSASRRLAGRSSGIVTRNTSHRRRPSVRSVKATNVGSDITRDTASRLVETEHLGEQVPVVPAIKNESAKDSGCMEEKWKGLWSIYSVCSELGLSGTHHDPHRWNNDSMRNLKVQYESTREGDGT